jgi:hypothetical protein
VGCTEVRTRTDMKGLHDSHVRHAPAWIPTANVEVAKAGAYLGIRLESPARCGHFDPSASEPKVSNQAILNRLRSLTEV